MSNKEKLITNPIRQGAEEIALAYRENLKAKEAERISPYKLIFDRWGNPNFSYERSTELGKMEYQGMMTMRELAVDGAQYMVWLSPPGGISNYTEGRLIVGKVISNRGEVVIECRGMPLLKSREEFREIILQLGENGMEVEDLRKWAIEISADSDKEFWDFCEKIFGNKEVWDYIREGKDIENKEKTKRVVSEVLGQMKKIGNNQSWYLEREMLQRGFEMVAGNHGGLNSAPTMINSRRMIKTAFDQMFLESEMMIKAERIDGKIVCPCGEVLSEGQTRCPKCGLKFITEDGQKMVVGNN